MTKSGMIVAGVMSGTSADGINVAMVRMGGDQGGRRSAGADHFHTCPGHASFELLGHAD